MPSPDDTFFRLKRLHAVFAVSSLALLTVTVWMIAADHNREWKVYQGAYRNEVGPWLTSARIAETQTDEFQAREKKLTESLAKAEAAVPDRATVERFARAVEGDAAAREAPPPDLSGVRAAYDALAAGPSAAAREVLLNRLGRFLDDAQLRRAGLEQRLRFLRADLDEARSALEIAVGRSRAQPELDGLQARVDRIQEQIAAVSTGLDRTTRHEASLRAILAEITRPEDEARRALTEHRAEVERLERTLARQGPGAARRVLEQPLVDAFARPLAIEQIWLPDLTIDYGFCRVARFDRCVTCHQGIGGAGAGPSLMCAVQPEQVLSLRLPRPDARPRGAESRTAGPSLEGAFGFSLAPRGVLRPEAPTVGLVRPRSPAAEADLRTGDLIERIDGRAVASAGEVEEALLGLAAANGQAAGPENKDARGRAIALEVRRGLAQPYCAHPRLDLFVGPSSPHPVETFGCTICHDGQGSATEFRWASHSPNTPAQQAAWKQQHGWFRNPHWDYPMLPARFAEGRCLKCHFDVTDLCPSQRFPDPPAPKLTAGYQLVRQHGCFGCHEIRGVDAAGRRVGPDMSVASLGKVGPSLRDAASKTGPAFLADWIADPRHFLPSARMPRFFGLYEPLEGKALAGAKRFEGVEVLAATEYLMAASQKAETLPTPPEVTEPPSAERGRRLFEVRGCLACHAHRDFPAGKATQGPDLSNVGAKYSPAGQAWLTSWLRNPSHYNPQTLMPNSLLEPEPLAAGAAVKVGAGEAGKRRMTDPAADLAAYLLSNNDFQPNPLPELVEADLDELALMYLGKTFPRSLAEEYLREGVPASAKPNGEVAELAGPVTRQKKLRYVGRVTIARRGCSGCHDIPGMERAQPIGPALSDWGRKQESLLAFEQVQRFLEVTDAAKGPQQGEPDEDFYLDAVRGKRREGFVWQKLRAPRSFDYQKAQNKPYTEWLLMGRFNFTPEEREQVITFVLGLVADPPAERYVYQPDPRRRAIVAGQKVLDKYACAECHTLQMERWTVEYDPATFQAPKAAADYDFVKPRFTPEELAASKATDRRGKARVEVTGMPRLDAEGKPVVVEGDEEDGQGEPLPMKSFVLWEPAALGGHVLPVGGADLLVYERQVVARRAPVGGTLARLLYPTALDQAKAAGVTVSGMEPWGWLPPPLVGEGRKARPAWLHQYLLNPTVIRPATVMRMPRFNLSPDEAAALVDYFAAAGGADFPYATESPNRQRPAPPGVKDRPDEAFRIVTDRKTFCAKCHRLGDYSPGEEVRSTLGPDLQQAGGRLRPDYIHRWLANPRAVLPYTGMPVNFPPDKEPLGQDLFPGTSQEQLEAVTRLIQDFGQFMLRRQSMRTLIEAQGK